MTRSTPTTRARIGGVVAAVGMALFVAACGSSGSSSSAPAAGNSTAASSTSATGVAVGTAKSSLGTYLTGTSGRALYIWVADSNGRSNCNGACASAWPPLITKATPTASGGAMAADLGMITRSDGSKQVTYKGRPLYFYVGDPGSGTTNGNGSNQFGAKWWLISPAGSQVGASASRSSSSANKTSSSAAGSSTSSSSDSSSSSSSGSGWG